MMAVAAVTTACFWPSSLRGESPLRRTLCSPCTRRGSYGKVLCNCGPASRPHGIAFGMRQQSSPNERTPCTAAALPAGLFRPTSLHQHANRIHDFKLPYPGRRHPPIPAGAVVEQSFQRCSRGTGSQSKAHPPRPWDGRPPRRRRRGCHRDRLNVRLLLHHRLRARSSRSPSLFTSITVHSLRGGPCKFGTLRIDVLV